jgi:hypothetical protein
LQAVRERLLLLDPKPFFKWFDDVLDSGGQVIAFNMGLKIGEQIMASITLQQDLPQDEILKRAAQVLYHRGFGHALIPTDFTGSSLRISVMDPPTELMRGSFVSFLAGAWAGVLCTYSGRRYTFQNAMRSKDALILQFEASKK